jgi:hypothetical protein
MCFLDIDEYEAGICKGNKCSNVPGVGAFVRFGYEAGYRFHSDTYVGSRETFPRKNDVA